jgi:hypothetical protein
MLTNLSSAKVKNIWSFASTTTNAFMPCTPEQPLPITILQVHTFSRTDAPNTFHTPSLYILFFLQRYNHSIKFYQCFICSLVCINSIRWEHCCEWYVIKRAEGTMESHIRLICSILHAYINALWFYGWKLYLYFPIYRVSHDLRSLLRENVPYVKIYRYNPKHLCPKLNGYGDNGQWKVWSSGGSTHCTCQLTILIDVCPWVRCPFTKIRLTLALYQNAKSVMLRQCLRYMCQV